MGFSLSLSLSLLDPKHMSRVSLTPQRRSFGSGCSWREGATLGKHGNGSTPLMENSKDPIDEDQEDDVFYNQSRPTYPNHTRKIDHVPYRSRKDSKGDWTEERWGKGGNWRNNEETVSDTIPVHVHTYIVRCMYIYMCTHFFVCLLAKTVSYLQFAIVWNSLSNLISLPSLPLILFNSNHSIL